MMYSHCLSWQFRCFVMSLVLTTSTSVAFSSTVWAQSSENVFTMVEPFIGAEYGMGYDAANMDAARGGRPCVDYKKDKLVDMQDDESDSRSEERTTVSNISKTLGISALAKYKSLSGLYAAESSLGLLDYTNIHEESKINLYWNYKRNATQKLMAGTISLKPKYVEMLKKGIKGKEDFRAECGNALVVGMQTGSYYYATITEQKKKVETIKNLDLAFLFETSAIGNLTLQGSVNKQQLKDFNESVFIVNPRTNNKQLDSSDKREKIIEQWEKFRPESEEGRVIRIMVAPYSVVEGIPPGGVLSMSFDEEKLEALVGALWELQYLKSESHYILKSQDSFAMGLPKKPTRGMRYKDLQTLNIRWNNEYDNLKKDTETCIESFSPDCGKLANWYVSHPPSKARELLPKKYQSACYGNIAVSPPKVSGLDPNTDPPPSPDPNFGWFRLNKESEADNMDWGPVSVRATLNLRPNGRELMADVRVTAREEAGDRATSGGTLSVKLFDLKPQGFAPELGMETLFEECEYDRENPVADPNNNPVKKEGGVYGFVDGYAPKQNKTFWWITFNQKTGGLLRGIQCALIYPGSDDGKQACMNPDISEFRLNLVNRLDIEAESWRRPCLSESPTLKNISTWKDSSNDTSCAMQGQNIKPFDLKGKPFKK